MDSQLLILPVSIDSPRDRAFPDEIMIAQTPGLGEALGCCTPSGFDLGTSGLKAVLVDQSGNIIPGVTAVLSAADPPGGVGGAGSRRLVGVRCWSPAGSSWRVGRCRTRSDWRGRCTAPSCSGRSRRRSAGDPLEDQRTVRECAEISERVGGLMATWTGNRIRTAFTATKILWLRRHHPDLYGRLRAILLPKDFLRLRLTGTLATDVTDASGTGVFDVHRRRWSGNALEALAIERLADGSAMARLPLSLLW
jgi:xylulokinase